MKTTSAALLLASASIVLSPLPAKALVTSTKAITCSASVKLQAAIDAVPAGTVATFNVSGTCTENLTIPQGKTIVIVGVTSTSKITAANGALPVVEVNGDATIQKMILTNTTGGAADSVAQVERGGTLHVIASDLSSSTTETIVGAYGGEVKIFNSRMVGGWGSGVDDWGGSLMIVQGDPSYPAGPTGAFESYVKSAGTAVSCGFGATLRVQAKTSGGKNGIVTIEQSKGGVWANQCTLQIRNQTSTRGLLRIRNNQDGVGLQHSSGIIENALIVNNTGNQGIYANQANLTISRTTVTGNQLGLNAQHSQVDIGASTFSNVTGDVWASETSGVFLNDYDGASSFPKALNWTDSFNCWHGARIDVGTNALVTPLGTKYDFLGCLFSD